MLCKQITCLENVQNRVQKYQWLHHGAEGLAIASVSSKYSSRIIALCRFLKMAFRLWVWNESVITITPFSPPNLPLLLPAGVSHRAVSPLPARPDGARARGAPAGRGRGQALPGAARPAQKLPGEALLRLAARPLVALQTPGRARVHACCRRNGDGAAELI